MESKDTLVAFFSRSGENFRVGDIKEGNGKIIADTISSLIGCREYEIASLKGYSADYEECSREAKAERDENARPSLLNLLPDMAGIVNVVLVYPNWWGDLPMPVYTFLDSICTDSLNIYPVCTHEDNGLGLTDRMLSQSYPRSSVRKGLAIRGTTVQNEKAEAEKSIVKYLESTGLLSSER